MHVLYNARRRARTVTTWQGTQQTKAKTMTTTPQPNREKIDAEVKKLAQHCVSRAKTQGTKCKRRDQDALEFWAGAMACADASGDTELSQRLSLLGMFKIARDGFKAIEQLAAGE